MSKKSTSKREWENGSRLVVLREKMVLKAGRKCIPSSSLPLVPKVEPFSWAIKRIVEEDTSNVTLGDAMQEVEAIRMKGGDLGY